MVRKSLRLLIRACAALALYSSPLLTVDAVADDDTPSRRVTNFADGVRIDWSTPAVEVAAEVVLREGSLELFGLIRIGVT